jgi:hypothetical protein
MKYCCNKQNTRKKKNTIQIHTSFYITLNCFKIFYILYDFSRNKFCLNNKLLESRALMDYVILQYSTTIYINHQIYLMMALCGQNMSLNLHERMDYAVIRPIISGGSLDCICACMHMCVWVCENERERECVCPPSPKKTRINLKSTCDLYPLSSHQTTSTILLYQPFIRMPTYTFENIFYTICFMFIPNQTSIK